MQAAFFASRAALVAALLYAQLYLLTTQGVLPGIPTALAYQAGLQFLVMLVAPAGFRVYATALAAWVSVVVAVVIAFAWVTLVVPFAAINAALHGEMELLLGLLGLTAYLLVPVGLVMVALMIDAEWDGL